MNVNTGPQVSALPAIVMLLFMLGMVALAVFFWGTIFRKAGYSFWLGLVMLVPLANVIWLLVFAFSKWPIHRELEAYRIQQQGGYVPRAFPVNLPPGPMR